MAWGTVGAGFVPWDVLGAEGHSCMTGDVPRDMLGSG